MTIALVSFAGHDIQSATYASWLELPDLPYGRDAEVRTVQPIGRWGRFVRYDERERVVVVHLEVKTSFVANGEVLSRWFRPGSSGALVAMFDGTSRALDCVVRRIVPMDGSANRFTAVLVAPDPRWRSASLVQDVEAVTASGQTWEVTNSGNATEDGAVIRVKPTSLKLIANDWRYQREIIVANRVDRPLSDWAVELTGGGWDHVAEVTASRSLSSGDDVRVLVDGVEVPRWDGGGSSTSWNDTGTKIWANLNFSPGLDAELLSTITDSAPATNGSLEVVRNSHQEFPDEGYLLLGSEVIRYTGKTATAFTGITRGARGTTAAAATAGDRIWWVERRVQLMYGYTNAPAPESRDERKPMIDLDASTNTSHVWADFAHDSDPRSMQWSRSRSSRDGQAGRMLSAGGEPAASMVVEYQSDGPVAGKPNFNTWSRPVPVGTASGGTLSMTREVDGSLAWRMFGRDEDGNEVTVTSEAGVQASGTKNVTLPTAPIYNVEIYARSQVVASEPVGSTPSAVNLAPNALYQQFRLESAGKIGGFAARVKNTTGSSGTITYNVLTDVADVPGSSLRSGSFNIAAAFDGWAVVTFTELDALADAIYWLNLNQSGGSNGDLQWYGLNQSTDLLRRIATTNGANAAFQHQIHSIDIAEFQSFAAATDTDTVTFDGVTIPYVSTQVPYVAFGAQADAYWLDGTLTNNQTGQSVALALLCRVDDEIEIDVGSRTVRNLTTDESVLYGATFSDEDAWIEIEGGDTAQANELQYDEADLVGVTVDMDFRSRWL